ncbi:MAG: GNAT family N-acetyltransferase [Elusimicrobiales bacterium]|nr:GNAT family N-acetyltransferase [Elusimicrobiales bacterium]
MELKNYSQDDLWLTQALESDPVVMKDLGGPTPQETILEKHKKRLKNVEEGKVWWLVIIPKNSSRPVGTIGIWDSDINGVPVQEMGWMILPAYQGRGIATEAGLMVLERARLEKKFKTVHALASSENGASNAVCRKLGFSLIGEADISYNGPPHKHNDWAMEFA